MTAYRVLLNPPDLESEILEGLNQSFPGWGDEAAYHWYFRRKVGGPTPDVLVLRRTASGRPSAVVGTTGLNYRRVVAASGDSYLAAIFTSAWTAPEERGRGHFGRVVREVGRVARSRGCQFVIGFVTAENPSGRALAGASYVGSPSWYLVSTGQTPQVIHAPTWRSVEPDRPVVDELWRRTESSRRGRLKFRYDDPDQWTSQFLHRTQRVDLLRLSDSKSPETWAVVEASNGGFDRVQLLLTEGDPSPTIRALLFRSQAAGRQLFVYACEPGLAEVGRKLGMEVKPGLIYTKHLDGGQPLSGPWALDSGDRM